MPPAKAPSLSIIQFRKAAVRNLPAPIGVYALCDLDDVPVYVGRSRDGIRKRVQRHLTSARSDVIANRMIDVWEIAYVRCWPVAKAEHLAPLEAHLFHEFNNQSRLMNGSVPAAVVLSFPVPAMSKVQILPAGEIADRQRVQLRVSRQAKHFGDFLDRPCPTSILGQRVVRQRPGGFEAVAESLSGSHGLSR